MAKKSVASGMLDAMSKAAKKVHKPAGKAGSYGLAHGAVSPKITSAGGPRHSGVTQKQHDAAYGRGKKRA